MLINYLYKTNISDSAGATKIFRKNIYSDLTLKKLMVLILSLMFCANSQKKDI